MSILLDTDTCIYWLKGNKRIEKKAMAAGLDTLHVSFITLSELYYGVYKSQKVQENLDGIKALEGKIKRVPGQSLAFTILSNFLSYNICCCCDVIDNILNLFYPFEHLGTP